MPPVITYWCDREGCSTHGKDRREFILVQPQHNFENLVFCSHRCLMAWFGEQKSKARLAAGDRRTALEYEQVAAQHGEQA